LPVCRGLHWPGITAGVPQHVHMHLEGKAGALADALNQAIDIRGRGSVRKRRSERLLGRSPNAAPVKKVAREVKQPIAPALETVAETVAVEVIEQPVPGVAEVEETRKAS
jgi:hypothetical protein